MLETKACKFWNNVADCKASNIRMMLAAKGVDPLDGENGYANTTWIAKDVLQSSFRFDTSTSRQNEPRGWEISNLRLWLHETFFQEAFPADLGEYLKTVIKYSVSYLGYSGYVQDYPSKDYLWIPSYRECFGGSNSADKENNGYFYQAAFGDSNESRLRTKYGESGGRHYWLRSKMTGTSTSHWLYNNIVANTGQLTGYTDNSGTTDIFYLLGFCL